MTVTIAGVDRLEAALLTTGMVKSVWFKAEQDQVYTVMCRPIGEDGDAKFSTMARLATALLPSSGGKVLIAQQFVMKEGRLGYSWNVSVFGLDTLQEVERSLGEMGLEISIPGIVPEPARQEAIVPGEQPRSLIKVIRDTGRREDGGMKIVSFPLPHVRSGDRNSPTKSDGSPLGHGKGAALVRSRR